MSTYGLITASEKDIPHMIEKLKDNMKFIKNGKLPRYMTANHIYVFELAISQFEKVPEGYGAEFCIEYVKGVPKSYKICLSTEELPSQCTWFGMPAEDIKNMAKIEDTKDILKFEVKEEQKGMVNAVNKMTDEQLKNINKYLK